MYAVHNFKRLMIQFSVGSFIYIV